MGTKTHAIAEFEACVVECSRGAASFANAGKAHSVPCGVNLAGCSLPRGCCLPLEPLQRGIRIAQPRTAMRRARNHAVCCALRRCACGLRSGD